QDCEVRGRTQSGRGRCQCGRRPHSGQQRKEDQPKKPCLEEHSSHFSLSPCLDRAGRYGVKVCRCIPAAVQHRSGSVTKSAIASRTLKCKPVGQRKRSHGVVLRGLPRNRARGVNHTAVSNALKMTRSSPRSVTVCHGLPPALLFELTLFPRESVGGGRALVRRRIWSG